MFERREFRELKKYSRNVIKEENICQKFRIRSNRSSLMN